MIARVALVVIVATTIANADRKDAKIARRAQPTCSRVHLPDVPTSDWTVVGEVRKGSRHKVLVLHRPKAQGYVVKPGECVGVERVPFDELRVVKPSDAVKSPPVANTP